MNTQTQTGRQKHAHQVHQRHKTTQHDTLTTHDEGIPRKQNKKNKKFYIKLHK